MVKQAQVKSPGPWSGIPGGVLEAIYQWYSSDHLLTAHFGKHERSVRQRELGIYKGNSRRAIKTWLYL
jgi:hypothetical protein